MLVRLDEKALEPSLVQVPTAALMVVFLVPPHVRHADLAHEFRQRGCLALTYDQMPVIGHQTPCKQVNRIPRQRLADDTQERPDMNCLVKKTRPRVTAV